ncbi:MAG: hypothetical protein C4517_14940 [Stygiobacter sp.]|nr:MAG: hypothetical protein C4517_14940 [Stygiobacter sp.]
MANSRKANTTPAELNKQKPNQKPPFYFYLILFSIPLLFFVLLEVGLRVFNYGDDLSMWEQATPGKKIINAYVAKRYFLNVKNPPTTIEDVFDSSKAENSFRVFVLGESSAAGYPYMPLGSFSRYIRKRLELAYPGNKIEVVNLGMTAICSYTIRDFMPEVIKQKPDVVLIYTGHNEYYGALGVGSLESLGKSRTLVNLYLSLNNFKTIQLVKDFLQWVVKSFSGEEKKRTGTLMSRMAKEQSIGLDSGSFNDGIDQFDGNMRDVIQMCKNANIPLILGTLTYNLKDQKPFISVKSVSKPDANSTYAEAQKAYASGNYNLALELFRKAKDLDALRFRAPEKINSLIRKYKDEYSIAVADIDSVFNAKSPNGIVGDNLMTDHLHPTLEGFQLMGSVFFDKMREMNLLPKSDPVITYDAQDYKTREAFLFSSLDSTMAKYRIALLKNDWPFIDPKNKIEMHTLLHPANFSDSIAYQFMEDIITWPEAHEKLANKLSAEKKYDEAVNQMRVLIYQYPVITEYYNYIDNVALSLLKQENFELAYKILQKRYMIEPNAFVTKWLGNIDLNNQHIASAVKYLEESVNYDASDIQTLYNLAGAYALDKQYNKGFQTIEKVLQKDSNYPGARELEIQLRGLISK